MIVFIRCTPTWLYPAWCPWVPCPTTPSPSPNPPWIRRTGPASSTPTAAWTTRTQRPMRPGCPAIRPTPRTTVSWPPSRRWPTRLSTARLSSSQLFQVPGGISWLGPRTYYSNLGKDHVIRYHYTFSLLPTYQCSISRTFIFLVSVFLYPCSYCPVILDLSCYFFFLSSLFSASLSWSSFSSP